MEGTNMSEGDDEGQPRHMVRTLCNFVLLHG